MAQLRYKCNGILTKKQSIRDKFCCVNYFSSSVPNQNFTHYMYQTTYPAGLSMGKMFYMGAMPKILSGIMEAELFLMYD